VRIVAPYRGGPREVEVHPTEVPGLVVGEDADRAGHWMVMHKSGAQLADLPSPAYAVMIAGHLGRLGDWDRSGPDVAADRQLQTRWSLFMYRTGLAERFRCRPANVEELAFAEDRTKALHRRGQ
jgi:hypothetical protein